VVDAKRHFESKYSEVRLICYYVETKNLDGFLLHITLEEKESIKDKISEYSNPAARSICFGKRELIELC
jgi:hypothetical protein